MAFILAGHRAMNAEPDNGMHPTADTLPVMILHRAGVRAMGGVSPLLPGCGT
jgi:hypothetical protein